MRTCQHKGCTTTVNRGGERGPWPKYCVPHRLEREAQKRKRPPILTKWRRIRCPTCSRIYHVAPAGNYPATCKRCARKRKRAQSAERQRRFRERHAKAE